MRNDPNARPIAPPICALCAQPVNLRTDWPVWDAHFGIICRSHAYALQEARRGFHFRHGAGVVLDVIRLLECAGGSPAALNYLADYAQQWCSFNSSAMRTIRR